MIRGKQRKYRAGCPGRGYSTDQHNSMQGKGEGVNEVVKMGEIWGVWKGRWKVGCLGEKELHVCTGVH